MASIWIPRQHEDREAWKVHQAVRQYDEDLAFGRNEQSGQWCIFLRQGSNKAASTNDLPILGFNQVPGVDEAMQRLRNSDAKRRGEEILFELRKHNEDIEKERKRRADEGIAAGAEALDWGFRKMGAHPFPRIFVPGR